VQSQSQQPITTLSLMSTWSFARLQKRHNLSTSSTASRTIDHLRIWLRLPLYNFAQLRFPSHNSPPPTKPQKLQPQIAPSSRTIPPRRHPRQSSRNFLTFHTEKCESYRRRKVCTTYRQLPAFSPVFKMPCKSPFFFISYHQPLCSLRNGRTTSQRYAVLEPPGVHCPATTQPASA
jgi:hypothetical protein